jgi:hypothetical protein
MRAGIFISLAEEEEITIDIPFTSNFDYSSTSANFNHMISPNISFPNFVGNHHLVCYQAGTRG